VSKSFESECKKSVCEREDRESVCACVRERGDKESERGMNVSKLYNCSVRRGLALEEKDS
jgi:hypothetical protein